MKISPQMRVLMAAVRANVPVVLWDEPGTGKSAVVENMFDQAGFHVEPVIASHRDPSDMNGLPVLNDGKVQFASPRWAERANESENCVVFLDEFSTATPAVQAATLRMLNERWVGEMRLGDNVRFILAANPPECAAGGYELTAPAANRMLHIDWQGVTADDWALGLTNGWESITPTFTLTEADEVNEERKAMRSALVSAFIMRNPAALHQLPTDPAAAGRAWASRRSWEMFAKVLAYLDDDDFDAILLAASGCVGEGLGTEFAVFLQNADLPNPREVLNDPSIYDFTDPRLDRTFVLLTSVVAIAASEGDKETWDKAWGVLEATANADRTDLAVGAALRLMKSRQPKWMPPASIKAFVPMLKMAGLLSEAMEKKAA